MDTYEQRVVILNNKHLVLLLELLFSKAQSKSNIVEMLIVQAAAFSWLAFTYV